MTRFLYIADTHLGANPMEYQQQQGYPERFPDIRAALREYLLIDGGIDFILHGGDMVDAASDDNILAAVEHFDLPVPVYLCLGNHDVTVPTALERWLELAPDFFPGGTPEYAITAEDCVIHVVPNHWDDVPYYWGSVQDAHLSTEQIGRLTESLSTVPQSPHMVLTHSPVYGLPPEQTGFSEPYHAPGASFTTTISDLLAKNRNIRCVLGAHTHMNMRVRSEGVEFVTVSALVETPFEFKVFDVAPGSITMSTAALDDSLDWSGEFDAGRSFVKGRPADRSFSTKWGARVTQG